MAGPSVVIPVYRDDEELSGLLSALKMLSIEEIIIVDGEARPQPQRFSPCLHPKIRWIHAPRGRGGQTSAGIHLASYPHIWVLHADSRPRAGSEKAIAKRLSNPKTSLTCFPLSFRTPTPSLSLFAFFSRIDSPLTTFGDQGFAFRKADYAALGLNLTRYPLLEDVALRAAFAKIGRIKKAGMDMPTSARRFERLGVWRTQIRNIRILLKYWTGTSPRTLHTIYYKPISQTALSSQPSWPERQVSKLLQVEAQRRESDCPVAAPLYQPARL